MKPFLFIFLGVVLFLAGCNQVQSPVLPEDNDTPRTCEGYCQTLPHVQCTGNWKISGNYPACVCSFECENATNDTTNITPPFSPPPSSNNTTVTQTCQEYCPTQPHIQCVGTWNISGTYPDCNCGFVCNVEPVEETIEIQMIARQWNFEPATITVKKGDHVKLIVTSEDVTHGISIPAYNINVQLPPGSTQTIEFVADQTGQFPFRCSVFCGSGHSGMTGMLIVDE